MPTFQMRPHKHEHCINQTDKGKAWYLFLGGEDWPSRGGGGEEGGGGILSRKYIHFCNCCILSLNLYALGSCVVLHVLTGTQKKGTESRCNRKAF